MTAPRPPRWSRSRVAPRVLLALLSALAALAVPSSAHAQTPIYGFGAMQPSKGRFYAHVMPYYRQFDGDATTQERNVQQFSVTSSISYALLSNLAVTLDVPLLFNNLRGSSTAGEEHDVGFGDLALTAKWRIWQHDTGPTDTMRVALMGGLQIPGGTTSYWDSTEDGWNPLLGAVFSMVRGRHGANASLLWEFDTYGSGQPDGGLRGDASYLFRVAPERYGEATSHEAWYLVAELNGLYETNGNTQLFLSPGVMYEATWFTLDANVMIPISQDLKDRPELEIAVGIGLRLTF